MRYGLYLCLILIGILMIVLGELYWQQKLGNTDVNNPGAASIVTIGSMFIFISLLVFIYDLFSPKPAQSSQFGRAKRRGYRR